MNFDGDESLLNGNKSERMRSYLEEIDKRLDDQSSPKQIEEPKQPNQKGLAYAIGAALAYSFIGPLLKLIFQRNPEASAYEVLYWQALVMMGVNYLYVKSHGEYILNIPKQFRRLIFFRAFAGFGAL